MKATDRQEGGSHYAKYTVHPAQFMHQNNIPFIEGNIIKYILRHRDKNGLQDLLKAKHYIDLLIEFEYENRNTEVENNEAV